ncbi:hypothetical protein J437_LFUL005628 [Ladona fulva]|uniref:EF-hand domain-containing protein n=1 Tax=Ladona fulva TaxID=123851 RepID=A0A8K0K0V3_LADFU|nr:hypothetical protein J437_LFUL005628 [Ladona fulva]
MMIEYDHDKMDVYLAGRLKRKHAKLLEQLKKKTKFSENELLTLTVLFYKINEIGPINRRLFRVILHNCLDITDATLLDRIFIAVDTSSDNFIDMSEFICGLSIFLRGSLKEKIEYCFSVFDVVGEGRISRDQMNQLLKNCIVHTSSSEEAEESAKDLVDHLLKHSDKDNDGRMSLEDFSSIVTVEPLLLEALGTCLPTREAADAFQVIFNRNSS